MGTEPDCRGSHPDLRQPRHRTLVETRCLRSSSDDIPGQPRQRGTHRKHAMPLYLISFNHGTMQVSADELPEVAEAAHAVVREARAAGVLVFAGGVGDPQETSVVARDGTATSGTGPGWSTTPVWSTWPAAKRLTSGLQRLQPPAGAPRTCASSCPGVRTERVADGLCLGSAWRGRRRATRRGLGCSPGPARSLGAPCPGWRTHHREQTVRHRRVRLPAAQGAPRRPWPSRPFERRPVPAG